MSGFIRLCITLLLISLAGTAGAQSISDIRGRVENVTSNLTTLYCSVFYPQQGYATSAVGFRYGNPNANSGTNCGQPTASSGVQIAPTQPGAFTPGQFVPVATITDFNNPVFAGLGGPAAGPTITSNLLLSVMGSPALPYTISKHETPNNGNCVYGPQITDCYDRITLAAASETGTAAFIASDGNAYTLNVGGVAPATDGVCPAAPTRQGAVYYDVPERATTVFCVYARISPVNAIRIVKSANPAAATTNFAFTSTQSGGTATAFPASFTLTGANSTSTSEIIRTYAGGTINIRESALAGWQLTNLACVASDGNLSGVSSSLSTGVTLTNLPTGSTNRLITCTFTNTLDNPQMTVEKTVSPTSITAPGTLTYNITVRNTGNIPLTGLALTDTVTQQGTTLATPAPTFVSGDTNSNNSLDVGESWVYRASYAATQANIDNGNSILNSVSARTTQITTPQVATATTAISASPAMSITKTTAQTTATAAGQVITYDIRVANRGNVTLNGIALTDTVTQGGTSRATPATTRVSGDTNSNSRLDVGETWIYSASYTVTQADINNGANLLNTATVASTTPGASGQSATATTTLAASPAFSVTKTAGATSVSAPGPVSFTITVRNEGNVTLTGVSLADTLTRGNGTTVTLTPTLSSGDTNTNTQLDVGETWTYTASYPVTQADLDDGRRLSNSVSVTTVQSPTPRVDTAVVNMVRQPAYTLSKAVNQANITAPGTLTYTITIANTGNIALTNPAISDQIQRGSTAPVPPTTGPTRSGGDTNGNGVLDVGETWTYAATYAVTQAMINAGQPITNRVETGFDQIPERRFATATTLVNQAAAMSVTKTVDLGSITTPGPLTYTIVVRNVGNTDLTGLAFTDTINQGGTVLTPAPVPTRTANGNGDEILDVGEFWQYRAVFTVTQAQIDNGARLENTFAMTSTQTPSPVSGSVRTQITQSPAFSVEKTVDPVTTASPGTLTYQIRIQNDGNVSLSLPLAEITDRVNAPGGTATPQVALDEGDTDADQMLDVGEVWLLSTSYALTQAAIDAGDPSNPGATGFDIVNTVRAAASFGGNALIRTDIATTTVTRGPAMSVLKSVDRTSIAAPGSLAYTITVENTGNVALTGIALDDRITQGGTETRPTSGPTLSAGDSNGDGVLNVGERWTYVATYAVNQAAIDAGGTIRNSVTVTSSQTPAATANASTTIQSLPALSVTKTVDQPTVSAVGPLNYTISVRNSGNVTLQNLVLNDSLVPSASISPDPMGLSLAPGQTRLFTAVYNVTQADLDAGGAIVNTVTASADGLPANAAQASATSQIEQRQRFAIGKQVDRTAIDAPGTLNYAITVTNTGNVSINGCELTDRVTQDSTSGGTVVLPATAPVCSASQTVLAPGQSWTWSMPFTVTQAMIDRGTAITNTATFDAENVSPDSAQAVTVVGRNPGFSIDKTVSAATISAPGSLTYTITVRNTGNVTLTNPSLSDPALPGLSAPAGDGNGNGLLDVGETWVWTGTRQVTQAMIDAGTPISNSATFSSSETQPQSDEAVTQVTRSPLASISKTVSPTTVSAPETVSFTVRAENTGNVTLTSPVLSDPLIPAGAPTSGDDGNGLMEIGEIWVWTLPYDITQEMIDAGSPILNTASFDTAETSPQSDAAQVTIQQDPGLALVKTGSHEDANGNSRADAGERVNYVFTVSNTGNVALRQIDVTDASLSPQLVGTVAQLAPGATATLRASYALTQEDIDRGRVTNTALARGQTANGAPVEDTSGSGTGNDTPTVVTLPAQPGLSLDKRLAAGEDPTYSRLGRIINYEFEVTNTGNVTLAGPVTVTDSLTTTPVCPAGNLLPGASMICTASSRVTQADLDRGEIDNTATANADGQSATDRLIMLAVQSPALTLVKSSDHSGAFGEGIVVNYSYEVTNSGNQTISGPITVSDNRIPGGIECLPSGSVLLPGNSRICTASYTVTEIDSRAGSVTNNATATGQGPNGPVQSPPASVTVPADADPALTLAKQFVTGGTVSDSLTYGAGDTITYRFTVRNTGQTDIFGPLRVDDATLGETVTCSAGSGIALTIGETVTCDLDHVVTQADLDRGQLVNTATATGNIPDGIGGLAEITSPPATATAQSNAAPALSLTKTAEPAAGAALGDVIAFTVTARNDGSQTLRDLRVLDPMLADFACPSPLAVLAPGETMVCSGSWQVTQADIDAGEVSNTATATAFAPPPASGGNGVQLSATATAVHQTQTGAPALDLAKVAALVDQNGDGVASLGDAVEYTLTVRNTGNVTLRGVEINDPMLGASPVLTLAQLLPGDSRSLVRSHTLTQAQLDDPSGQITNTANASGRDPDDATVTAPPASASLPLAGREGVDLVKTGTFIDQDGDGRANAGDQMAYVFAITNTGTVTLTNVVLTDALVGVTVTGSPLARIAPGDTDRSITGSYELTQDDIDRGTLANDATVTAQTPNSGEVTDQASHSTNLDSVGALRLVKTGTYVDADSSGTMNVGDRIDYVLEVTNTGTETLAPVVVSDPLLSLSQTIARMAPGATELVTRSYVLRQSDIDEGTRDNLADAAGTRPNGSATGQQAFAEVPLEQQADFTLTKDAAYQDSNGDGRISFGDEIVYRLVVRNTGTVTLNGIEISDPLLGGVVAQTGALEPNQEQSVLAEYPLTQDDIDAGSVTNEATAQAYAPNGELLTREAGTTTPLDTTPAMTVTKVADQEVIGQAGVIAYTITLENTGATTLRGIALEDQVRQDDVPVATLQPTPVDRGDGNDTLSPGEVWTWRASYAVGQEQIDDGSDLVNRIRITAANTSLAVIAEAPTRIEAETGLDLVKTASAALSDPAQPGDVVTYTFRITNTGQQRLDNVTLTDPKEGMELPRTTVAQLAAGATVELTGTYALTQDDLDRGLVSNQALVSGTRPDRTDLRDLSGPDPATDAPTVVPLDPAAELVLVKSARHDDANGDGAMSLGETLVYSFTVQNAGNVVLRGITVSDPMLAGSPFGTVAILAPGETRPIPETGSHVITEADVAAGSVTNTATASGARPDGETVTGQDQLITSLVAAPTAENDERLLQQPGQPVTITILSNDSTTGGAALDPASVRIVGAPGDGRRLVVEGQGIWTVDPATGVLTFAPATGFTGDPDPIRYLVSTMAGVVSNSATVTVTYARTGLDLQNEIVGNRDVNGNGIFDAGDIAVFEFTVTNTGNVPLTGVTVATTSLPLPGLVCVPVDLAPGETVVLRCTGAEYTVTEADMQAGEITMTAEASGEDPWGAAVTAEAVAAEPVAQPVEPTLELTKRALLTRVTAGQDVPFEITVENLETEQRAVVDVIDTLPPGFLYRRGSGRVDGEAVETREAGNRVTFDEVTIEPGETVVIRLTAFVPGSVTPGEYVNRVIARDSDTGNQLGNEATATVTIEAEPVFDCGTVIGRVFDDQSGDGYQQPGELGIGGVRLVTVNGVFVTSDQHGRFHLPCPDLPRDIGSNFVLKLDESSLPADTAVTSENPRVIRLTAGKMTEANFGVARLQVVAVDLAAMAFAGNDPIPALVDGLQGMVAQIATRPSLIRLNYTEAQESRELILARLQAVTRTIRAIWPATASYQPRIDTQITRQRAGN
ncbi:DUF7507 domain-containing protein [Paracoccus zhejiangensis]|uniref:DUF11 domain-containing protein n=1 Tax=Paracoccus zhejiangensis TaxID=1077935 RepID=A0A2H5EYE2_9RHOB|nr:DUF11 domain-containing protein [Paracoccus zhejiangensis]AUH64294.1 hypothetical protein CX676_09075 [Paracoccus zhejiangensis]